MAKRVKKELSTIRTFNLGDDLHNIATKMVRMGNREYQNYTLDEVDADMLDCWIENAIFEGDKEYENFLSEAQLLDADVYVFTEHIGEFSQTIGEVVVYN